MARDFIVAGPLLVSVRGGMHWIQAEDNKFIGNLSQLGLCQEAVQVRLKNNIRNIGSDSVGPGGVVDVAVMFTECEITMKLVHFDPLVLSCCISDSLGGTLLHNNQNPQAKFEDVEPTDLRYGYSQQPAGKTLGNGLPRFASGNYYVGLNLECPEDMNERNWRFFYAYLMEQPNVYKMGSEASTVELTWRAIRYVPIWQRGNIGFSEINQNSKNAPLWPDQTKDFPFPDGTTRTYTLVKEISTKLYPVPLWDHNLDNDQDPDV